MNIFLCGAHTRLTMFCKNCRKEIGSSAAVYCPDCGEDYCELCANELGLCGCFGHMRRYS